MCLQCLPSLTHKACDDENLVFLYFRRCKKISSLLCFSILIRNKKKFVLQVISHCQIFISADEQREFSFQTVKKSFSAILCIREFFLQRNINVVDILFFLKTDCSGIRMKWQNFEEGIKDRKSTQKQPSD